MKHEKLAQDIIELVGGKDNVNSVVHCITRLRFKLKDESKADTEALKKHEGVVTVRQAGGQYQVVIGNHVPEVYKAVVAVGGFESRAQVAAADDDEEVSNSGNLFGRFVEMISAIFSPILGVLAATGMIKGLLALLSAIKLLDPAGGTYAIINIIGDSFFYFLPIFLGYTASKRFKGNPYIGMAIGASLLHPSLGTIMGGEAISTIFQGTFLESSINIRFLGIPVILMNYSSSVIPIILAAYFGVKVEQYFKRVIPDVVKTFLVPFFTLLITIPLTFLIIGPIAVWAGLIAGQFTVWLYNLSPLIAGLFLGGFWQLFVIFGLHWGLVPIMFNNIITLGSDPVIHLMFGASFAQTGAVLGVWLKTRNEKLKSLSLPAFISGIFGVTEPAIYGVTLPLKRPFIYSCIGGAVSGAIMGIMNIKQYIIGGLGIFGFPNYIEPGTNAVRDMIWAILAVLIGFAVAFLLTYFFLGKENEEEERQEKQNEQKFSGKTVVSQQLDKHTIASPMTGKVIELSQVSDEAFAKGAMGKGLAIIPTDGKVYAPLSGTVVALFPTNHAIGIAGDNGVELLIHIGIDTVNLNGKYFTPKIKQGDRVEQGQLIIEFDHHKIKAEGYPLETPVLITNGFDFETPGKEQVKAGDPIMQIKPKGEAR